MITKELFNKLFPIAGLNPRKFHLVRHRAELIEQLNRLLPKYGINTHARLCAFFANCGIETDYFKTTSEYASGWDYDISRNPAKARGLGNYAKGDGPKYKGGGLTQTTGKNNYEAVQNDIGEKLGIDVVRNPELLRSNIAVAVESACIFWADNNLNFYADRGRFKELSAIVNRGDKNKTPLHWAKRNELYSLCKRRVPTDFSFPAAIKSKPAMEEIEPVNNTPVSDIQNSDTKPVVPTSAEPTKDDSFLSAALDKNLSADKARQMARTALPSFAARLWKFIARPVLLIYAALEAGNVAAWLGVVAIASILIYVLYLNRAAIKKAAATIKNKFVS